MMEQSGRVTNVKFLYRFYNLQFEGEQENEGSKREWLASVSSLL